MAIAIETDQGAVVYALLERPWITIYPIHPATSTRRVFEIVLRLCRDDGQRERGVNGVYVQDFVPGRDTSASRRPLTGFDAEHPVESFGVSPDGQWLTIAMWEQLFSIMVTDGLPSL